MKAGILILCLFVVGITVGAALASMTPIVAGDRTSAVATVWATLGALPGLIIVQHALLLWMEPEQIHLHAPLDGARFDSMKPFYEAELRHNVESRRGWVLLARFGIPAFATVASALLALAVPANSYSPWMSTAGHSQMDGLRYGGLGAYVYVLLHLGQRYFQRDITTGGAMWCSVNLVLGPALGFFLEYAWTEGASTSSETGGFTQSSVYFLAGLSPRFVTDRVNDLVRRFFYPASDAGLAMARTLPLTQIRGVTSLVEERLYEEGIFDVFGLAMANPFRLMRRTPYDKRQIVSWIDEAILMLTLPDAWRALESAGISGAIDLAVLSDHPQQAQNAGPGAPAQTIPPLIVDLAKAAKMEPMELFSVIARLSQDTQVSLLWGLYQMVASDDGEAPH